MVDLHATPIQTWFVKGLHHSKMKIEVGAYLWEDIKQPKGVKLTSQLDRA